MTTVNTVNTTNVNDTNHPTKPIRKIRQSKQLVVIPKKNSKSSKTISKIEAEPEVEAKGEAEGEAEGEVEAEVEGEGEEEKQTQIKKQKKNHITNTTIPNTTTPIITEQQEILQNQDNISDNEKITLNTLILNANKDKIGNQYLSHYQKNNESVIEPIEPIETLEPEPLKIIDNFFNSIIEKPVSPICVSQNDEVQDNSLIIDPSLLESMIIQPHQIYPPLLKNINIKNNRTSLFTNLEIKSKLDKFSENEFCEIFKIIKNNNEKYTTNNNGIFINLSSLKKCTINEICNLIVFCENNHRIFDREEQTRDIYRDIILDL